MLCRPRRNPSTCAMQQVGPCQERRCKKMRARPSSSQPKDLDLTLGAIQGLHLLLGSAQMQIPGGTSWVQRLLKRPLTPPVRSRCSQGLRGRFGTYRERAQARGGSRAATREPAPRSPPTEKVQRASVGAGGVHGFPLRDSTPHPPAPPPALTPPPPAPLLNYSSLGELGSPRTPRELQIRAKNRNNI